MNSVEKADPVIASNLEESSEVTKRINEEEINISFASDTFEKNETINTQISLEENIIDYYFVESGISVTNSVKGANSIQLDLKT